MTIAVASATASSAGGSDVAVPKAVAAASPVGWWRIEKVAGYADSPQAGPEVEKQYIGQVLKIEHGHTELGKDAGVLGEAKRWDTLGKEWLEEYRTNPKDLQLPRYVRTYDIGFGGVILRGPNRLVVDLGGTWFWAVRQTRRGR